MERISNTARKITGSKLPWATQDSGYGKVIATFDGIAVIETKDYQPDTDSHIDALTWHRYEDEDGISIGDYVYYEPCCSLRIDRS